MFGELQRFTRLTSVQRLSNPEGDVFNALQQIGEEFGATTGRKRQCNWMDLDGLKKAVRMNGVTDLVFNKMDVLREVGEWKFYNNGEVIRP